jgi:hypothetical protein
MTIPDTWRKSSHSGGGDGNECVEIANSPTHIAIRDSKAPAAATLTFLASAYASFVDSLKSPTRNAPKPSQNTLTRQPDSSSATATARTR